jgi:hypothetical protein
MESDCSVRIQLSQEELTLLLGGIDLTQTKARNWYRKRCQSIKKRSEVCQNSSWIS